jgi:hypothetical protein
MKLVNRSLTLAAWCMGAAVVACAAGGDTNGNTGDGGSNCPPGSYDLDADPAHDCEYKCTPGPAAPDDPIDPMYTDENCDGTDGVVSKLLFVASDGTDTPNAGSRQAPMKTLAFAIATAQTQGKDVAVSGESYPGELDLVSGVSVYGQFNEKDAQFAFRREASVTSTLTTKGTVVVAKAIDKDTHLEFFEIDAAASDPPNKGLGTYGVRFVGGMGTFYVRWNTIRAEPGQDGTAGTDGATGAAGVNGANGENGCNGCNQAEAPNPPGGGHGGPPPASTCGGASGGGGGQGGYDANNAGISGGNGSGANSQGGQGGAATSSCPTSQGSDGQLGQSPTEGGASGADGMAATAKGSITADGTYAAVIAGDGAPGAPGNAGGGGGGGAGGTATFPCNGDRGSGGGSGGTGGCGGTQGTGGGGGGASFGIIARAGKLIAGGNTIESNRGGTGGAGGKGGGGGPGGRGGAGGPRNDDGGASGSGGNGTTGGTGGNGAGGAGGPSACIAMGTGVVLQETPVNMCTATAGGKGGAAGNSTTNVGPDGLSMPTLTF